MMNKTIDLTPYIYSARIEITEQLDVRRERIIVDLEIERKLYRDIRAISDKNEITIENRYYNIVVFDTIDYSHSSSLTEGNVLLKLELEVSARQTREELIDDLLS